METLKQEEIVPYIRETWDEAEKQLVKIRAILGAKYNTKNAYEQIERRFCSAREEPEKWLAEYMLIEEKRSDLPSAVRRVVHDVVSFAIMKLLEAKKKEQDKDKE